MKNVKRGKRKEKKTEKQKWNERGAEMTKMDHLENVHFGPENNTEEPPSNVWFSWEQSAFSGCDYSPANSGGRPVSHKAAPLFPKARATLFQNVDYFPGKTGSPPARGLRGT